MDLSQQERLVLSALDRLGVVSVQELSKATKLPAHSVRYILDRLKSSNAIRPLCSINPFGLGFHMFTVYFSVKLLSATEEVRIIKVLTEHQHVSWVAEFSGEYQYGCGVYARNLEQALTLFGEMKREMNVEWFGKAFTQQTSIFVWPLKYFAASSETSYCIYAAPDLSLYRADETDHHILRMKSIDGDISNSLLARKLGLPESTISYRVQKMEKAKVINATGSIMDWQVLGLSQYNIVVTLRDLDNTVRKSLVEFGRKHPLCSCVIPCAGSWDFEFNIFARHQREMRTFTSELWQIFGDRIISVKAIPNAGDLKWQSYPFRDFSAIDDLRTERL